MAWYGEVRSGMVNGYELCPIDAVTKEPILKDRDEVIEFYKQRISDLKNYISVLEMQLDEKDRQIQRTNELMLQLQGKVTKWMSIQSTKSSRRHRLFP